MINIRNFYTLVSQPNGNEAENCLTTFKPKNGDSPMWYDRPCNDTRDGTASQSTPGHKFMCESNVPAPITTTDTTPVTITTSASTSKYKYIS